ncbi:MAG: hypothetical protein NZO16_02270 [Deltaproteobacteria bacterium]|nr:hypothetical protein [Deltaproteobacteria bacterium]
MLEDLKQLAFQEFTASEVCLVLRKLLGTQVKIGLSLLNYYVKNNIICPTGTGMHRGKRKFSFSDLVLLYWLFKLKREGVSVSKFKEACEIIQRKVKKKADLMSLVLATDGERIYVKSDSNISGLVGQVLSGKGKGQYVWIFGFKNLTEDVKSVLVSAES